MDSIASTSAILQTIRMRRMAAAAGAEEMLPIVPRRVVAIQESEIGFVDQGEASRVCSGRS